MPAYVTQLFLLKWTQRVTPLLERGEVIELGSQVDRRPEIPRPSVLEHALALFPSTHGDRVPLVNALNPWIHGTIRTAMC